MLRLQPMSLLLVVAAFACLGSVTAQEKKPPAADKDGWQDFFDGKTLDGW